MKTNEYELAYREARAVLHRRGKRIVAPIAGHDGLRYCGVDGCLLSDWEIFREAWDVQIADELVRDRGRRARTAAGGVAKAHFGWAG